MSKAAGWLQSPILAQRARVRFCRIHSGYKRKGIRQLQTIQQAMDFCLWIQSKYNFQSPSAKISMMIEMSFQCSLIRSLCLFGSSVLGNTAAVDNQYFLLSPLASLLQDVVEPEAKAAFIWILGEYGQSIQVCIEGVP